MTKLEAIESNIDYTDVVEEQHKTGSDAARVLLYTLREEEVPEVFIDDLLESILNYLSCELAAKRNGDPDAGYEYELAIDEVRNQWVDWSPFVVSQDVRYGTMPMWATVCEHSNKPTSWSGAEECCKEFCSPSERVVRIPEGLVR